MDLVQAGLPPHPRRTHGGKNIQQGSTCAERKANGWAVPAKGPGYDFMRIARAVQFAMEAHKEEFRKGTKIPYIVHPLDVLSILLKNGAGEDLAIAGLLHDITEDTDYTLQDIRTRFGDAVAILVEGASEPEELTKGVSNEEKEKNVEAEKIS